MRIGYCKLGRSMALDPQRYGFQGDAEAPQLLERLARRNPDVTWVITGRTTEGTIDLPNVVNAWADVRDAWRELTSSIKKNTLSLRDKLYIRDIIQELMVPYWYELDGAVVHVGQHGTSNTPIPQSNRTWHDFVNDPSATTNPQDWSIHYGGPVTWGLNALGDATDGRAPVSLLITDPRNYHKCRDIKWPTGADNILSQYAYTREQRHERFLDPRSPRELGYDDFCKPFRGNELWMAEHTYRYAGLELMILPDNWSSWGPAEFQDRLPAGVASTSFKNKGKEPRRSELIRDLLLRTFPNAEIFGKWDKISLQDVSNAHVQLNDPSDFPHLLNRWRVTLSLPALGSSWTVAKPFQCFAARTACFMWGRLDDQGWILPTRRSSPHPSNRTAAPTYEVADGLWSIRDDWTEYDIALARWLRIETDDEFDARARIVSSDAKTWAFLVDAQRDLLERRWNEHAVETAVERMMGICR